MRRYSDIARRYARRVVDGAAPACEHVRAVCRRALHEWQHPPRGLRWSPQSVARVCEFVELLPEIKGARAGQCLQLSDWQVFLLAQTFGWLRDNGQRRYRRCYIEVPRGNGKSTLSAAVGLYMLCADGEPGAECYSFAVTRDQARIVFDTAREMARRSSHLQSALGVTVSQHNLHVLATASKFEPRSSDADSLEGLNTHFACIDELHAHKSRSVYDVVETSMGKRTNNLLWVITTAGVDRSSVCYELHRHVRAIAAGQIADDQQFGLVYTIDPGDDWTSEGAVVKANPNYGVSVMPDVVRSLQAKAMAVPSAQASFRTRHLNEWVSARETWLDMRAWESCADPAMAMDDFAGEPCWIGVDLAERTDISCAAFVFRSFSGNGDPVFHAFVRHYLPRQTIERGENAHYRGWHAAGWITASGDASTDQRRIRDDIIAAADRHSVQAVLYDPAYASQMIRELQDAGVPCIAMRPSVLNYSEPMKTLEALVLERRFRHNGDPVLAWMAANVAVRRDDKDNVYPVKESYSAKIDGIIAIISALAGASQAPAESASVYESRGLAWI